MQPIPYFGDPLEGDWIFEPKIDGWRLQIVSYNSSRVEFWGRRLEKKPNWTERLHYLVEKIKKIIPPGTLLDGELYSEKGRRFIPSLFSPHPKVNPRVYIFDVIFWEEEFMGDRPLKERRKILGRLLLPPPFHILEYAFLPSDRDILQLTREIKERGMEGVVVKKWDSLYKIIPEGPVVCADWKKIK